MTCAKRKNKGLKRKFSVLMSVMSYHLSVFRLPGDYFYYG